jgi:hypothetical protein
VHDFTSARVGTGQIGKCIRFTLEVADGDAATPRSLIGKFPSDDPLSRQTGVQLRNFLKEGHSRHALDLGAEELLG